jgi:acetylornithine deacetylase/succinyl-diaminopimelate desuccinylase-like protein
VREADTAIALNGRTSTQTYLDIGKVIDACRRSGADAVHPGYGFLSENAGFAQAVIDAGLIWVGPSPAAIRGIGDKLAAKRLMQTVGVPTLDAHELTEGADATAAAERIGYPVLIKAAAGGGGRGMRIVRGPEALASAYLEASADVVAAPAGPAMRALVSDESDEAAIAVLTADPEYVGQIRTTCVPTMIHGGHAPNALPQLATANVNCRILPGVPIAEVESQLNAIFADPGVIVAYEESGAVAAPGSPLRNDVLAAVTAAVHARAPGLKIVPAMSAGATDTSHFRARGVPSYGVGTIFLKPTDNFAHGLNERLPVETIAPGMVQWEGLIRSVAG